MFQVCSRIGSSSCDLCIPGYGKSNADSFECLKCPPGKYGGGASESILPCSSCPVGTTSNSHGNAFSSSCTLCSSGYFGVPLSPGVTSAGCTICPAGSWSSRGSEYCSPCPPGTFSSSGSGNCALCPQNTYGSQAGLQTNECSGKCAGCPPGTVNPPSLTCVSGGARGISSSLGIQLWPAAHDDNPQNVDLIIAPSAVCASMVVGGSCAGRQSIIGADNIQRFVVGTAADLHMEQAEALTCDSSP